MATTLTLPSTRFTAQVNTGSPEAKANYKALAQRNALALEECPWSDAASDAAKPSLVEHSFTATFTDEKYDAFLMTGSYNSTANTEIAYAGMVGYRFALPQAYLSGSATLVSASIMLARDRFLLPGLRVSAVLSDSETPSTSWEVVRGDAEGCVKLSAQLANSAERITAAEQATGAVEIALTGLDATKKAYLWVYLTVEDYTATWTWYSSTQHRLYAIEGSGMVISQSSSVTFSADVAPDSAGDGGYSVLCGGIFPCVPSGAAVGERHVVVRADANLVAEADGRQAASREAPGENAAAALSRLYAEFYAGGGDTPSADNPDYSPGASFNVVRQAEDIPSAESDRPVSTDVLRIDASVLLAPFAWPGDATPTTLSLSFAEPSPADGARFNVFLADGYLTSLTQEQLKNPGLYDCRNPPFQFLGSFSSGTAAAFKLPPTAARTGTVVISAWFPPERYSLAVGGRQGTGENGLVPTVTLV